MAEILENHPFNRRGFQAKYPYDEWFDGRIWKLVKGTDYTSTLGSIRASLYGTAAKRGLVVRTSVIMDGQGIVVQAHSENMYMPEVEFGGEG